MSKYGFSSNARTETRLTEAPLGRYLTQILNFDPRQIKRSATRPAGSPFFKVRYRIVAAWPDSGQIKVMQGDVYEQTVFPNMANPELSNRDLINYCNAVYAAEHGLTALIDDKFIVMAPEHKQADTLVCVEDYIDAHKIPPAGAFLQLRRDATQSKAGKPFPLHVWGPMTEQTRAYVAAGKHLGGSGTQQTQAQVQTGAQTGTQTNAQRPAQTGQGTVQQSAGGYGAQEI